MNRKISYKQITIIGLGLMGGAFAKALSVKTSARIVAVDQSQESINYAKQKKWIYDGFTTISNSPKVTDLIVLATPVSTLPNILQAIDGHYENAPQILDISSVKANVINYINSSNLKDSFISCHPMVGSEKGGILAADQLNFENKTCLLLEEYYCEKVDDLLKKLGFECIIIKAQNHDKYLAVSSHFPYLMACLTSRLLERQGYEHEINQAIVGSGFLDTTRISQSEIHWGLDVCLENKNSLKELLNMLKEEITNLEDAIESSEKLKTLLSTIKAFRSNL